MLACIETVSCGGPDLDMYDVDDRAVQLAVELNAEGADDNTIDDFLDAVADGALAPVVQFLGAIARGKAELLPSGAYVFLGEKVGVGGGMAATREQAAIAYVEMRLMYG